MMCRERLEHYLRAEGAPFRVHPHPAAGGTSRRRRGAGDGRLVAATALPGDMLLPPPTHVEPRMNLNHTAVGAYLRRQFGAPVEVLGLAPLGAAPTGVPKLQGMGRADQLKLQGYGRPVLVHFCLDGHEHRVVLRTMEANVFGHERRADRAAGMLLSYDTFNDLPQHVRALDVGVLAPDGQLVSVGAGEFFLLTDFAPGTLYADDLRRLRTLGLAEAGDRARARALATYLSGPSGPARHRGSPIPGGRPVSCDRESHSGGTRGTLGGGTLQQPGPRGFALDSSVCRADGSG